MTFKEIQYKISALYEHRQPAVSECVSLGKSLAEADVSFVPEYVRKIKAAFLSSFTVQGLPEVFRASALFNNVWADTYLAPYNQFTQEILNSESGLYRFDPALSYLIIDKKDIADNSHLETLVKTLLAKTKSKVVIFNFVSEGDAQGDTAVPRLNETIKALSEKETRVFVYDFNQFLQANGKDDIWNTKYAALGDFRIHPEAFPRLAYDISRWAVATAGATKKCAVLDLDNTLWAGIAGEDDFQTITPNKDLQKFLQSLAGQGALLAIASKNNFNDALEVLERHPDMALRKKDFANLKIDWQPKDINIRAIAAELKLGLDSFVFADDSPFERDLIRTSLPEIAVITPEALPTYPGFHSVGLTAEDFRRGEMYKEEEGRKEFEVAFSSVEDFLRELKLSVAIYPAVQETIPRISQLTQKTNQFNLTTRRYGEDDVKNMLLRGWKIWSVSAKDRFGDYGIIGVCIIDPAADRWKIDTLLLSCRILGRKVEDIIFTFLCSEALKHGAQKIGGEFIPTKKNAPASSFFSSVGFRLLEKDGSQEVYEHILRDDYSYPDFITVLC